MSSLHVVKASSVWKNKSFSTGLVGDEQACRQVEGVEQKRLTVTKEHRRGLASQAKVFRKTNRFKGARISTKIPL